jgi:ParB family chromosome partitioning protein
MPYQSDSIFWVELHKIVPNPYQPRREFNEQKLQELSESIRMYGLLQPITVTRKEISLPDGAFRTEYELIAGERRLRASKIAGLSQIPVIIRSGEETDLMKLELAIIENLQREDLNPIDRAEAFRQLADKFDLNHTQVAAKVGRSREYVSNTLRLLQLPQNILEAIGRGEMSEGHGRALLMLSGRAEEMDTLFREILLKKLSVREVERISRKIAVDRVRKKDYGVDPELIEMERQFTESLGTRVQIERKDFGGKLVIDYFSPDDLRKILSLILAEDKTNPIEGAERVVSTEEESPEAAVDDRSAQEQEEDADLYAITHFSL